MKSEHVLKLKPKLNRKDCQKLICPEATIPKIKKKGRQAKSKLKSQKGRRLSKTAQNTTKPWE